MLNGAPLKLNKKYIKNYLLKDKKKLKIKNRMQNSEEKLRTKIQKLKNRGK